MLLAVISFSDRWGRCGVCVQCVESTHFKIQFGCYKWFDNTHLKVIKWSSDNYICLFCWQNTANLVQSPIICLSSVVKHIFWPTASTCTFFDPQHPHAFAVQWLIWPSQKWKAMVKSLNYNIYTGTEWSLYLCAIVACFECWRGIFIYSGLIFTIVACLLKANKQKWLYHLKTELTQMWILFIQKTKQQTKQDIYDTDFEAAGWNCTCYLL